MKTAPDRHSLGGMLALTATYVYFLLFAQYGFLRLLAARLGEAAPLAQVMVVMGVAGLVTSLTAGAWVARERNRMLLDLGFVGAGLTALASSTAASATGFTVVAAAIGCFTGLLTVALASDLRALVGGPGFGMRVGIATGSAYLVCNLPGVFSGPGELQAAVAAGFCLVGLVARTRGTARERAALDTVPALVPPAAIRPLGFAGIALAFGALVWLDSAAFAIIQSNAAFQANTWSGARGELVLGGVHLVAACLAGIAIDRGRLLALPGAAIVAFLAALPLLQSASGAAGFAGALYVAGISVYSVALVAYPASRCDEPGSIPVRWRAALLFGLSGWVASALGVGMARDLAHIPVVLLWLAGGMVAAGLLVASASRLPALARAAHGAPLALVLAIGSLALVVPHPAAGQGLAATDDPTLRIEHGREVYVQEGCVNCHSQYVRPLTRDVEWWGPARSVPARGERVLIGNRRQGPDLTNVGNRRSAKWQRLHLLDPRSVSPGSRMPAYAHLFEGDARRGEDLVAYLTSLGADTAAARRAYIDSYPRSALPVGSADRGATLFAQYCTPCHGPGGRGDGPLARAVGEPGRDLLKEHWWAISWGPGAESEDRALARLIKFGVDGTSMPGHETLGEREVADLVAHLQRLRERIEIASARPEAP